MDLTAHGSGEGAGAAPRVTDAAVLDMVDELLDEPPAERTRRSWWPIAVVVISGLLVLVASTTAVLTALRQSEAAARAASTSRLADTYQDALYAATVEQSLERAVRLTEDPKLAEWHREAGEAVSQALDEVQRVGGSPERGTVEAARVRHERYTELIGTALAGDEGAYELDQQAVEASEDVQDILSAAAQASYRRADIARESAAANARTTASAQGLAVAVLLLVVVGSAGLAFAWWRRARQEQRRSQHRALHDELTGLPNRLVLQDRMEQALLVSRREGVSTALLVLDLDRFKEINDALGHDYGDLLLQQIAPRLRPQLREYDSIARLGGDEFAVVLPRVAGLDGALLVAEKLRRALEEPFTVNGMSLAVEASVGVTISPDHGDDARTLLQRAEIAMYLAKENQVGVSGYDSSVDGHSPARAALLGDLRKAIMERQLSLVFQPKSNLVTGELEGVEALVRWQHPEEGLLSPDRFVPLAERTGLVHPLTRFVLDAALAQCRAWFDDGLELPVAVNLSTRTLLDHTFSDEVRRLLEYWKLPSRLLTFEITESALMSDPVRAAELLRTLADLGVRLAIDDFGTGYSSLSSLRMLPVHELKIDRSFVKDMLTQPHDASIVRAIVDLGHTLSLRVVAEGVEDEATAIELARLGCDVGQGYHLGAPTTARRLLNEVGRPRGAWVPRPSPPLDVA
jgi:diguanylate cyclase